jgi:MFS family permease
MVSRSRHIALGGRASLTAAATLLGTLYAGSTILTPLYQLYQRKFGLSELMITLVYATYVIGNLAALFVFGRVSDQAGRRSVSLIVIAVSVFSAAVFLFALHPAMLFVARAATGLAIAVGAATTTAWIAELHASNDNATASRLAAAVNLAGLAVGVLVAGLLAQYAPWPLRTVFVVYLAVLLLMAAATAVARETVESPARSASRLSFEPHIGVPPRLRVAFTTAAVTAFATFALLGFYAALLPNVLAQSMQLHSPALSGAIVAELFAVSAVTVVATPMLAARTAMLSGLWLLPPSLGLLLWAQVASSIAWLIAATALCGIATALGFRGSLQEVNRMAPADQRAELLSAYLLCCYAGNSLPVIGIALLSRQVGHLWANIAFASVSVMLAAIALAIGMRRTDRAHAKQ